MSLVNAIFNMTVVNRDDLICTFNDKSLTVDFTEVVAKSKVAQLKVKGYNLFDLVKLTGLVPEADGLHVYSKCVSCYLNCWLFHLWRIRRKLLPSSYR